MKIYIPTVHRYNNQITYNHLPDELKKNVVLVIQAHELAEYNLDLNYCILPNTPEYHYSDYYCLPRTRKYIYDTAKDEKYVVLDDDLNFHRRNSKYFGGKDNMEKSRRNATPDDILEMFELYEKWLDEPEVTFCGCSHVENPPSDKPFVNNSSLGSGVWFNGRDFNTKFI